MNLEKIQVLIDETQEIINHLHEQEKASRPLIANVNQAYQKSATNMVHYVALRSFDIRTMQKKLGNLGMSRIARAEAHVQASLQTTLFFLQTLAKQKATAPSSPTISIKAGEKTLKKNTQALLGKASGNRRLRIMVTIPSEAVEDYQLVEDMISKGMNCARINCAHDGPEEWLKMIDNIKKASSKLKKEVIITMDLGGPKIRTGEIESGPKIKRFKPKRNEYGTVLQPTTILLVSDNSATLTPEQLPVDANWLQKLSLGDKIRFTDTRHKNRKVAVDLINKQFVRVSSEKTIYIETGTVLSASHGETTIGELPAIDQSLFLKNGDMLVLHQSSIKGQPATYNTVGELTEPAYISCTLPEALSNVQTGDPVFFDDGKIKGIVREKQEDRLIIDIVHAASGGAKLKSDKGINFPDSNLNISGLTQKDREDLKFISQHADVVNFSFVNKPEDVVDILSELEILDAKDQLGIILKIETQKGYDNLTQILFEAMKTSTIGVMIARGDLAIEAGWERIGSIQKEILAICNASHVPVVWATQVLENLAKTGLPSRSEITDAVNATKADCVMLNKGPHITEAISLLDQIIESMETYQDKNAPILPKLKKISKH